MQAEWACIYIFSVTVLVLFYAFTVLVLFMLNVVDLLAHNLLHGIVLSI